MSQSVLIVYTTKYGSTHQVALAVTSTLQEVGFEVEFKPAKAVEELGSYDAVVVATALYMGRLHGDARRFLTRSRKELSEKPVALLVLGPIDDVAKNWNGARNQLRKELAKLPWFTPVVQELFGGRFDPESLGFPLNLIPPLRKMPANDCRDWAAIRSWVAGPVAQAVQGVCVP